jgi:hypothetical protein
VTLIISLITPEFVCQISDRRLTDINTGDPIPWKANKTIIVPPARMMVSHTGLAQATTRYAMDEWLALKLFELRDTPDFFARLADDATELFRRIRGPARDKRHAFAFVGWMPEEPGRLDRPEFAGAPFYGLVSNFIDPTVPSFAPEAWDAFTHVERPLMRGEPALVFTAGAGLPSEAAETLVGDVRSALRSASGNERAIAQRFVRVVETVASRDSTVGGGAFVAAIAKDALSSLGVPTSPTPGLHVLGMRWGLPEAGAVTFLHVPDTDDEGVESPMVVGDPFAGKMRLRVSVGDLPTAAGARAVPEAGSVEMRLLALRSSDEIRRRTERAAPEEGGG